jgi:hypothetical protein
LSLRCRLLARASAESDSSFALSRELRSLLLERRFEDEEEEEEDDEEVEVVEAEEEDEDEELELEVRDGELITPHTTPRRAVER